MISEEILKILYILNSMSKDKIFLVGGAIRDSFLKIKPEDLDFSIEGAALNFAESNGAKLKNLRVLSRYFNSCSFEIDGFQITLSSAREDIYLGNKLVNIRRANIKKDLLRRDFKVNAMALTTEGELLDPLGGIKDLKERELNLIERGSFAKDPSRLVRACRHSHRCGLVFSKELEEEFWKSLPLLDAQKGRGRVEKEIELAKKRLKDIQQNKYFNEIVRIVGHNLV